MNHRKIITKCLREITRKHCYKARNASVNIVPGKSLCPTYYSKIFIKTKQDEVEN